MPVYRSFGISRGISFSFLATGSVAARPIRGKASDRCGTSLASDPKRIGVRRSPWLRVGWAGRPNAGSVNARGPRDLEVLQALAEGLTDPLLNDYLDASLWASLGALRTSGCVSPLTLR